MAVIIAHGLHKAYAGFAPVLRGVDIEVEQGELVAIMGPSGCGKSTMLHILGMLHAPDKGTLEILGTNVLELSRDKIAGFRRGNMGFVMQSNNLFEHSTVFENVEFPLIYERVQPAERWERVIRALDLVHLSSRVHYRSNRLSGGEQQRVAIARAMVNEPRILLADEPTGALDARTSRLIMDNFRNLCHACGVAMVMVTHDPKMADFCDTIYTLEDGLLVCHKHELPQLNLKAGVHLLNPPEPKMRGALIGEQIPTPAGTVVVAEARQLYQEGLLARIYTLCAAGLLANPEGYSLPLAIRRLGRFKVLTHLAKFLSPTFWRLLRALQGFRPGRFWQTVSSVISGLNMAKWCRDETIEYLYAADAGSAAAAAYVCAQVCHIPFGFVVKASDLHSARTDLAVKAQAASFIRVGTTALAKRLAAILPETLQNKIHALPDPQTIFPGEELDRSSADKDHVVTIVAVGTLDKAHGYDVLLTCCKMLQDQFQIIVKIAGTGPELKHLKALAKSYGGLHMVSFLGYLPAEHMDELLENADIFVAPMVEPALLDIPTAIIEAMTMQLPVIASDLPILREVVQHEVNGLLIQPKDPNALAKAITRLANEPDLAQALGKRGQQDMQARFQAANLKQLLQYLKPKTDNTATQK